MPEGVRLLGATDVGRVGNLLSELKTLMDKAELAYQEIRVHPDYQRAEAIYPIGVQRSLVRSAYDDLRQFYEVVAKDYTL